MSSPKDDQKLPMLPAATPAAEAALAGSPFLGLKVAQLPMDPVRRRTALVVSVLPRLAAGGGGVESAKSAQPWEGTRSCCRGAAVLAAMPAGRPTDTGSVCCSFCCCKVAIG